MLIDIEITYTSEPYHAIGTVKNLATGEETIYKSEDLSHNVAGFNCIKFRNVIEAMQAMGERLKRKYNVGGYRLVGLREDHLELLENNR